MQLSELIADCRSRLNEPSARLFTDAEITRWLNQGYSDFVNKSLPCENTKAYAVVANQARYARPSDALLLEEVLWEDRYAIEVKDIKEFRSRMYLSPTVTGSIPTMYCEYPSYSNAEFQLWPVPGSSGQSTTLSGNINTSVATIPVASTTGFPRCGWLVIGTEQIWYNDLDATNFLQCERGKNGSTAASHLSGDTTSWGKLTVRYIYMPALLASASDTPAFPLAWHEALILYATKIGFEKMGKLPEAQLMLTQYEGFINRANNVRASRTYDTPTYWSGPEFNNNVY